MVTDESSSSLRSRRRKTGQVTIRDVAQLAGVAPMTVSRAISNPALVSEAVRERVQQAVQASGYVPNLIAGALSSGNSRLVAALVPAISTLTLHPLLQALEDTLDAHGYQMLLGQTGYNNERLDSVLETFLGRRPAAFVLTGLLTGEERRQRLRASGVPVVETWDFSPDPVDMLVGFSHEEMARAAAHYFHQRGRRRIALLGADDMRSLQRRHGFVAAAKELGLAPPQLHMVKAPATLRSGREGLARFLDAEGGVDSVFCSSDMLAMGVLIEAQQRRLSVPRDLAILGVGDLPFAADLEPALSSIRLHGGAIGQRAAECILARIEGQPRAAVAENTGFSIITRGTT
ncbi:MAG: LacI family DNA-binding transcriptional regulator [Comamonas sp.]|uniref:LacI family DNA-binding transcriptional regulator n=1 Tax=Comamonas sp. TaxID=34028 RepID=UPI002FC9BBA5